MIAMASLVLEDYEKATEYLTLAHPQLASDTAELQVNGLVGQGPSHFGTQLQLALSGELRPVRGLLAMVLEADEPSMEQLQDLLQAWLNRKAIVLAGGSLQEARLADVARRGLLVQVQEERARDAAAGTTQVVKASITSADLVSLAANRIELRAQVAYSDQRLDAAGNVIDTTAAGTLPVTYVLGRDGKRWRLHAYVPS